MQYVQHVAEIYGCDVYLTYTTGDEPVYTQERYYRPDRVQYRVMLRRHNNEGGGSKIDEFRAVFAEHAPAAGE